MKFIFAWLISFSLLLSTHTWANAPQAEGAHVAQSSWLDSPYLDNTYAELQSGSLLGLVHASLGKVFADNHHLKAGFGYVPKMDDHVEMSMVSFAYRYQNPWVFEVAGKTVKPFSVGVAVLRGEHRHLFAELPERYPDGYYTPTAFRIIFNYQATVQINSDIEAYFDVSVLDVGMVSYVREPEFFIDNYDFLGLEGITNWGFGARYKF